MFVTYICGAGYHGTSGPMKIADLQLTQSIDVNIVNVCNVYLWCRLPWYEWSNEDC